MRRALLIGLLVLDAASTRAADLSGNLKIDGQPTGGVVVYFEGETPVPAQGAPRLVVMDQKNLEFLPAVLPIVRGTTVEFTNSDDVQHNVFTPSPIAGRFNLGTYNRGETRSVTFNESGDIVILCNIHMEMEAHILVLDGPRYAVSDATGAFFIPDVPPGAYALRVWQRMWLPTTYPVTVRDGEPLDVDIQLPQ
jgi:plastocyanin